MSLDVIPAEPSHIADTYRIRPENMMAVRTEGSQSRGRIFDRCAPARVGRIRENADQRVLCEWTSRPSAAAIASEPCVSRLVMQVRGIEQCHEDVHIEQRDHGRGTNA